MLLTVNIQTDWSLNAPDVLDSIGDDIRAGAARGNVYRGVEVIGHWELVD